MEGRYAEIFCREAGEHLANLQEGLLALEKNPSRSFLLNDLLRDAHTLKGAARMLGLGDIAAITHAMEEQLKEMQTGERAVDAGEIDLLLQARDTVALLTTGLQTGVEPQLDVEDFLARYRQGELALISPAPQSEPGGGELSETVRTDVKTLDTLVNLIGEMIINKKRLEERSSQLAGFSRRAPAGLAQELGSLQREMEDDVLYLEYLIQELHGKAMGLRMLPLKSITGGFERHVRDLAREQGKEARLELSGGSLEMDRVLLEALKPSLLHILTNAVCHGLESRTERMAQGKRMEGTVRISAFHHGDSVVVEVRDDGRGMDPGLIRRRALERGVIGEAQARELSDEEALYLTLRHGFSTSLTVTETAGRGIGLDVVQRNLDRVKGSVILQSEPKCGTAIRLQLPLTLSVMEALLVDAGAETFAVPASYLQEVLKVRPGDITREQGKESLRLRGKTVPLRSLSRLLGWASAEKTDAAGKSAVLVLKLGEERLALAVEATLGSSEVVVKGLGRQFGRVRFVFGATILGDGSPALILNVPDLFRSLEEPPHSSVPVCPLPQPRHRARILVVDDSVTARTMLQSILSSRGYQVAVAVCAEDALERARGEHFDLVVSDLEMPGMSGFELTRRLLAQEEYRELPVVIVSSLSRDEEKREALSSGAQAYIVKGAFDQETLLETVEMLVG